MLPAAHSACNGIQYPFNGRLNAYEYMETCLAVWMRGLCLNHTMAQPYASPIFMNAEVVGMLGRLKPFVLLDTAAPIGRTLILPALSLVYSAHVCWQADMGPGLGAFGIKS